ncbi:unnamed protein product (macronuclear) [Paramecium tetraurelia]|uniref:Uncharacterized protein n=1 Tax=Paramecium tetraurelia TaxID=5888 RepID=A0BT13_PARTE|nr:uncharacterized protein GSPATT00031912001 [Paramecium tetraurelia]CAK61680.1 unnamed protein product [Paramecium tetraurelia]|eukprot:XP_001429078.1 hypothetical protein (macronuclear) [Paramecium tetraurelia strain d4-2]
MQQMFKQQQAQQFLAQQFSSKPDKIKLSNLIPTQINENFFNKKTNEVMDKKPSSPRSSNQATKPSQKPSQQIAIHKSNMSLQNKSLIVNEQFQEKLNQFSKRRDHSPNSQQSNYKKNEEFLQRRPSSLVNEEYSATPQINRFIAKSPTPSEIQESVASLLQNHQSNQSLCKFQAISSPKGSNSQKPKTNPLQLGPYLSIQQQQQKSSHKGKGHSSANSVSYNLKPNILKKCDYGMNHTPTKVTTTTLNTEHSKSKSVLDEQCIRMIYYDREKENDVNLLNIGTPSTYLHSKVSIEQQSVGESLNSKFHHAKILSQQSPYQNTSGSNDHLQESFPVRTCINHRTKKAKYFVDEHQKQTFYCSQCAITVASQGKIVQDLSQLIIKSQESQILSFQSSSVDSNRHSNFSDANFKERELSGFLTKLECTHSQRADILNQMQSQIEKINQWYESQIGQCQKSKQVMQQLMNDACNNSIQILQNQRQESLKQLSNLYFVLQQHQLDAQNIKQDIEKNWTEVLEDIRMDPFRKIMDYYQSEFVKMNDFQTQLLSSTISVKSLSKTDIQSTLALIIQNFQLSESEQQLILHSNSIFNQQIRTQPTPPKKRIDTVDSQIHQSNQQQRVKTDYSGSKTQPQNSETPSNFYQYFNDANIYQLSASKLQSQQSQQNPNKNNLYISFENKDIFMNILESEKNSKQSLHEDKQSVTSNPIMILESYRESKKNISEDDGQLSEHESHKSTPHSPASGQTKQSVQRTATKLEEHTQIPKDAFQKQKSTFRTLFDNTEDQQNSEVFQNDSSVSPAKSEKFRSILNKISNNQSKTQQQLIIFILYQILPTNDLIKSEIYIRNT